MSNSSLAFAFNEPSPPIAEISALAIHPRWRKTGGSILFPLMKFMYGYCTRYFDTRHLVIAVNPAHIDLLNVYDIAQKPALQVSQHLEVRYLARLMIQYSVKRVLVIDNNELQGFVSITDVVGSLMDRALREQDR